MKEPRLEDFGLKESDFKKLSDQKENYRRAKEDYEKTSNIVCWVVFIILDIFLGVIISAILNQSFFIGFFGSFLYGIIPFAFIREKIVDYSNMKSIYIDNRLENSIDKYETAKKDYECFKLRQKEEFWINLNPYKFEQEVANYFNKLGFYTTVTKSSRDGGVDVILKKNDEKIAVQCKHFKNSKVGPASIRELYGVVMSENYSGGYFVSLDGYSDKAIEYAEQVGIELFSLKDLISNLDYIDKNVSNKKQIVLKGNSYIKNYANENKNLESKKTVQKMFISTETILNRFIDYLKDKKYKEYTNNGCPSTAKQYAQAIQKVANWENLDIKDIADNIDYYIDRYDFGGAMAIKGNEGHRTIINALKRFREFLNNSSFEREQQSTRKNIDEGKKNKFHFKTENKKRNKVIYRKSPIIDELYGKSSSKEEVEKAKEKFIENNVDKNIVNEINLDGITQNSIVSIVFLDKLSLEISEDIFKVTANKEKSNENIHFVPVDSKLMSSLLGKKKNDIVKMNNRNIKIINIK